MKIAGAASSLSPVGVQSRNLHFSPHLFLALAMGSRASAMNKMRVVDAETAIRKIEENGLRI